MAAICLISDKPAVIILAHVIYTFLVNTMSRRSVNETRF
jgi:hypothetical protein